MDDHDELVHCRRGQSEDLEVFHSLLPTRLIVLRAAVRMHEVFTRQGSSHRDSHLIKLSLATSLIRKRLCIFIGRMSPSTAAGVL